MAVYDPVRKNVVLFGGQTDSHELPTDTWLWDGSSWATAKPTKVPSRVFPLAGTFAFDAARAEAILFGNSGTSRSPAQGPDTFTWAWNGSTWIRRDVAVAPPFRFGATMAFDGVTKRIVLFGGYQFEGPGGELNDTWVWDGATWKQAMPSAPQSPSPGAGAHAAYDERSNQLWLLTWDGAMWLWSSGAWVRQGTYPSVAYRSTASMLFDSARGKIVLYGGTVAPPSLDGHNWIQTMKNDLWAWDGTNWAQVG
jgi:hypothetical protein